MTIEQEFEIIKAGTDDSDIGRITADNQVWIYNRDWTVDTIANLIVKKTIVLDPPFQRRSAWNDVIRSRYIESLLLGIPVPQFIFAKKKQSYIVVDGRQRLMTLMDFLQPKYPNNNSDNKPLKLTSLEELSDLEGKGFLEIEEQYPEYIEMFKDVAIRATLIDNYKDDLFLYKTFRRINSGSVPLSSQELRNALFPGQFTNFLNAKTGKKILLHDVLRTDGPDARFVDVDICLRFIAYKLFGQKHYTGNLKEFLDFCYVELNKNWDKYQSELDEIWESMMAALENLGLVFNHKYELIGRKPDGNGLLNKPLLEVQLFYFSFLTKSEAEENVNSFSNNFKKLCEDKGFVNSISLSTTTYDNLCLRFTKFRDMINQTFSKNINEIPIKIK